MTSSEFRDRQKYPYFFRTCQPTDIFNVPRASFIKFFGWRRIGIIAKNTGTFLTVRSQTNHIFS